MTKIEEPLPKELTDIMDITEFENEAGIVIDSVIFNTYELYLNFSFRYYDETPPKKWRLTVGHAKEERIVRDWTSCIALYKQHPRLLEYTDAHTELYFNGTSTQSLNLFADIYKSLQTLTDNLDELKGYVLGPCTTEALCQQGYGLFARGPKTILMLYQQCLIKHGIHSYFVGKREALAEDSTAKLFTLGDSYIIGQDFHFERIS
ncbi:hypothetical protein KHS38_15220 [Mucilaginibacter sp. Bleaf8]|uniref:hypothetical protein n=1 Tax=Mucilaginibacter sp. Bleaf8 TaxID=2834430 RepID=UPI001BD0BC33|nr:hypothetical protein [Mucilaginibacter sp. Bleaf8]MBS7565758.1 hypothetical protein [Mucilaginibacter sp. Bleaf8]